MEKPVIAMLNGVAVGTGFEWVCASDIRIGSQNFRFCIAPMERGTFPGGGGLWLLPKAVGLSKATELIFTRDWVDAPEAYRIGFLNKLVPADELEKVTMEVARKCATAAPIAARLAKKQLNLNLQWTLYEAMEFNAVAETITYTSEDFLKEGIAAFREKRPPIFRGR
jgi:2-(1,2-epoxy-1,2-dihydrophenyl)acetyl-CoA isomerase